MLEKAKKIVTSCECGCKHSITTSEIECRDGATEMMISYIKEKYNPKSVLLVCDENTKKYSAPIVSHLGCREFVLPGNAHANEIETARLGSHISSISDISVMIACGSGSVHDITRYCAHETGVDFISYPTAASVDGFVSGVAAMTMYGQKLTYPSSSPVALFAEPSVFCDAPSRLTASGVGDMIGKIVSLFDWQVAHILTGEPLCRDIFDVTKEALDVILAAAKCPGGVSSRDFPVLVMKGLLLSGLAMQLAGNSRPASGSEHHMSHFWEMHVANPPTDALHGEKVGVGTVLMLSHIKSNAEILAHDLVIDERKIFSHDIISPIYGDLTDGIVSENAHDGFASSVLAKLGKDSLKTSAEKIGKLIDDLPSSDEVKNILTLVGGCVSLSDIDLRNDDDFIHLSKIYSPYVRNRLTFAKIIAAIQISEKGFSL